MSAELDLDPVKQRAGLKRWPTVAELGLIKDDNTALVAEVERLSGVVDRVRESVHTVRHALHLTGTLDAREVLHHITTAMEAE